MWLKLIILISISLAIVSYGVLWFRKSLSSEIRYSFKEDFKRSFLTPHWSYSAFFNDGKPRRIVPAIVVIAGIGILAVGLIKLLSGRI